MTYLIRTLEEQYKKQMHKHNRLLIKIEKSRSKTSNILSKIDKLDPKTYQRIAKNYLKGMYDKV